MVTEQQLEHRLTQWGKEYGGSIGGRSMIPFAGESYPPNMLQVLRDHHGFVPDSGHIPVPITTAADEVEAIVDRMMRHHGKYFQAGHVLRARYWLPDHWTDRDRIAKLRPIGIRVSEKQFYILFAMGRTYVLAALNEKKTTNGTN